LQQKPAQVYIGVILTTLVLSGCMHSGNSRVKSGYTEQSGIDVELPDWTNQLS